MKVVIDASVAIKWFVNNPDIEENTDQALEILQLIKFGQITVVQPVHWQLEIIAVLSRIQGHLINKYITLLDALMFEINNSLPVYRQAAQLSIKYQHHLFDTLYHAVAIDQNATLITSDKKYVNKLDQRTNILLLSDWTVSFC